MRMVPIGDLVQPVEKRDPRNDSRSATFTYVDIGAVSQGTKQIEEPQEVVCSEAPSRARQVILADDILVSTVRPNLNAVARVAGQFNGAIASTGFSVLRPVPDKLCPSYLYHWVRTEAFINEMMMQATGQSYPAVSDKIVKASEIPLPPLEEQKRIAGILDQADALRRLRARALDKLNTLGQAIFHEMFLSGTSAFPSEPLGQLSNVVRGSSPRPKGDPRFFGGPVPRLMIADLTRDGMQVTPKIDSLTEEGAKKSRPMRAGDVVMAVSGAVGLPGILGVDACIHDGFVGFRDLDERLTPQFLYSVLSVQRAANMAKGTGAIWTNLTTDQVKRLEIPMPPLAEQKALIEKINDIESRSALAKLSETKLLALFSSLQHRAFRGEL